LLSFTLSSTSNIESLDNIFFSYHAMGLVLGCSHKSLLLVYMYTRSSIRFNVNRFGTLLWINEYELQFRSHGDVEHTCTKIWQVMGVNVHPLAPIKSHHSCESKSRSFIGGGGGGVKKWTSIFNKICKIY
jgi:hypothetical protein